MGHNSEHDIKAHKFTLIIANSCIVWTYLTGSFTPADGMWNDKCVKCPFHSWKKWEQIESLSDPTLWELTGINGLMLCGRRC